MLFGQSASSVEWQSNGGGSGQPWAGDYYTDAVSAPQVEPVKEYAAAAPPFHSSEQVSQEMTSQCSTPFPSTQAAVDAVVNQEWAGTKADISNKRLKIQHNEVFVETTEVEAEAAAAEAAEAVLSQPYIDNLYQQQKEEEWALPTWDASFPGLAASSSPQGGEGWGGLPSAVISPPPPPPRRNAPSFRAAAAPVPASSAELAVSETTFPALSDDVNAAAIAGGMQSGQDWARVAHTRPPPAFLKSPKAKHTSAVPPSASTQPKSADPEVRYYKMQLCREFSLGTKCPRGKRCTFAHGEQQLRSYGGASATAKTIDPGDSSQAWNYKTKLCTYYESYGKCTRGARCNFAHGEEDLRRPDFAKKAAEDALAAEQEERSRRSQPSEADWGSEPEPEEESPPVPELDDTGMAVLENLQDLINQAWVLRREEKLSEGTFHCHSLLPQFHCRQTVYLVVSR
jgi:hypothetical protein